MREKPSGGLLKGATAAGGGAWHDMDMLVIGNYQAHTDSNCLTTPEEQTQFAIWCLSASPLIMGNDLRNVSAASRKILLNKEAIAISQDLLGKMGYRIRPAATFNNSLPLTAPTQLFTRHLSNVAHK